MSSFRYRIFECTGPGVPLILHCMHFVVPFLCHDACREGYVYISYTCTLQSLLQ